MMKRLIIIFWLLLMSCSSAKAEEILTLSTTTSTQASGLLAYLLPVFEAMSDSRVRVIAKGTGAALRDGRDGNVDLVFVHAEPQERAFVAAGYGEKRYPVMYNDFVLLGPADDPAKVVQATSILAALRAIVAQRAKFVSRGDHSGTHFREQALWQASGLTPPDSTSSSYFSIGQGMGKALTFADEKQAYILADRGTYLKYQWGRDQPLSLVVCHEGDPLLLNPYTLIPVNPTRYSGINFALAKRFVTWMTGRVGQKMIADYRLHGQPLFHPVAYP